MTSETFTYQFSLLEEILQSIRDNFKVLQESENIRNGEIKRLVITNSRDKLNSIFYRTGKSILQGKEGDLFEKVKNHLSACGYFERFEKEEENKPSANESDIYKNKKFVIGFDEAGKGEAIGSMFLASVCVPRDKIDLFLSLKKDIKSMTIEQLNYWCKVMEDNKIRFEYEKASALEITNNEFGLNRLMDRKYANLVRKYSGSLNKDYLLAFDDYGIRTELQTHIDNLKKKGVDSISSNKLDEWITATKLASVVARQIRLKENEELEKESRLRTDEGIISFGRGAPNHQTNKWLVTYRMQNLSFNFPDFVRKNWKNVKQIDLNNPKKEGSLKINCPSCKTDISLLNAYFTERTQPEYYCSQCNELIEYGELKKYNYMHCIADTSAYVAGMISKDIMSEKSILKGIRLIKPKKIRDEMDTIPKSRKDGAYNELKKLKDLKDRGLIRISDIDYEITDPYDADKKLHGMIARDNSLILITSDKNLAHNSNADGAFVIRIINFSPQKKPRKSLEESEPSSKTSGRI